MLKYNITIVLKRTFTCLCFFLLSSINFAKAEPLKILFIGNSYTHMNEMPKIFEKISKSKGEDVLVEMSAKSSYNFLMHSESDDTYEVIKKYKWDYVILQGFSREMSFDENYIDRASTPFFDKIIDSIYRNNSCTNIMLYMTWGYKEGYIQREDINSYQKMTNMITNGYSYFSEKYDISIVPVGHVWREIRSNSEINLYRPDHQHPTYHGSYLSACTFYASIFKESPFGAFRGGLNNKDAELIQNTAFKYVSDNIDLFRLDRNYIIIEPKLGLWRKDYQVYLEAVYPNSNSITWYLGDGAISDSMKVTHSYNRHGSYIIKLEVEDICGIHIYEKILSFKKLRRRGLKNNCRFFLLEKIN